MKLGSWRDFWHPEYYAGVVAGIGIGIFVASSLLPPDHRAFSIWDFVLAFSCIFVGATLATTLRNRKTKAPTGSIELEHKHDA